MQPLLRKTLFFFLMTSLTLGIVAICFVLALPTIQDTVGPTLASTAMLTMAEEERRELYQELARENGGMWDTLPEPLVARIAKANLVLERKQAEVQLNNAGFRATRDFGPKSDGVFRLICLGDSMVFGEGGRVEDRYCDQMEAFYREYNIRVDGKQIETYAVGLGSWTMVQETVYLSSRISAYQPDAIVLLSVGNDIADIWGITGAGALTRDFSPEHREWGSAFFSNRAGTRFGNSSNSALIIGLRPESASRWGKAMSHLERLVDLQHEAGGDILVSVLGLNSAFTERYKKFYALQDIDAPLLVTDYFDEEKVNRLPHDPHPSRQGHSILATHYIRTLDVLGWIDVPDELLPELHSKLSLELGPEVDAEALKRYDAGFADRYLRASLDFGRLKPRDTSAFLGGILKSNKSEGANPWSSVRSGWLMKSPPSDGQTLELQIFLPSRRELFPFHLDVRLDGESRQSLRLEDVDSSGAHTLTVPLPTADRHGDVIEIILETTSYFTEIKDHRMKSFQLISARIFG